MDRADLEQLSEDEKIDLILSLQGQLNPDLPTTPRFIDHMLTTLPDMVYIFDWSVRRNVYINHSVAEHLGYAPGEITAMGDQVLPTLMHPDDFATLPDIIAHIMGMSDTDVYEYSYRMRHKSGQWHWIEDRTTVHERDDDGIVWRTLGITRDVTELRDAQAQLQHERDHLQRLLQAIPDLVYVYDLETGGVTYENHDGSAFIGQEPGISNQMSPAERNTMFIHPADLEKLQIHGQTLGHLNDGETASITYRCRYGDDTWHTLASRDTPYERGPDGQVRKVLGITRDITDQTRAEEKYRLLAENVSDILVHMAPDGERLYVSPSVEWVLGYSAAEFQANWTIDDNVHPDDHEIIRTSYRELREKGYSRCEYRVFHKDGHIVWLETDVRQIRDANGNVTGIVGTSRDITDRKRIEQDLDESRRFAEAIADRAPYLIYVYDFDLQRNIYANDAHKALLAEIAADATRIDYDNILNITHPDDHPRLVEVSESLRKAADDEIIELDIRMGNETRGWNDLAFQIVIFQRRPDGTPRQTLAIGLDVTERKRLQAELDESRRFAQEIADRAPYMIYVYDLDKRQNVYVNAYHARLTGIDAEVGRNMPDEDLKVLFHPDDEAAVWGLPARYAVASDDDVISEIVRVRDADGDWRWFDLRHMIFKRHADGTPHRVLGISLDVTDRVQAQQQEIAMVREQERANFITQFVEDAAHELRTPLSNINVATHMVRRIAQDEKVEKYLNRIESHTNDLETLIDALFLMASIDHEGTLIFEAFRPAEMLRQAVDHATAQAATLGVVVALDVSGTPESYYGDPVYLRRVFDELLANALAHTDPGDSVTLRSAIDGDAWCVQVIDTGDGIPLDSQPYVFETFYRADGARSTRGFGLGLPIARRILKPHDGSISLVSTPGDGTTVIVTLPLKD